MPELPEVEVSRMGISSHILGRKVEKVHIRVPKLRWEIPQQLHQLEGQEITSITRRAKYLLLATAKGTAVVHLGMSGSLRILDTYLPPQKHDHVDLVFSHGVCLRYQDPRRFGAWLWYPTGEEVAVLAHLGPEPLSDAFDGDYLARQVKRKTLPVKSFLMDNQVVVGVGNIYANEALFMAKIHPLTSVNQISIEQWTGLAKIVQQVLRQAIKQGGTTLKDFAQTDGKPGYFAQELQVYGKQGQACLECQTRIELLKIGQRSTYFCPHCQPRTVS